MLSRGSFLCISSHSISSTPTCQSRTMPQNTWIAKRNKSKEQRTRQTCTILLKHAATTRSFFGRLWHKFICTSASLTEMQESNQSESLVSSASWNSFESLSWFHADVGVHSMYSTRTNGKLARSSEASQTRISVAVIPQCIKRLLQIHTSSILYCLPALALAFPADLFLPRSLLNFSHLCFSWVSRLLWPPYNEGIFIFEPFKFDSVFSCATKNKQRFLMRHLQVPAPPLPLRFDQRWRNAWPALER